jgi:SAM-dependent methyltransferase
MVRKKKLRTIFEPFWRVASTHRFPVRWLRQRMKGFRKKYSEGVDNFYECCENYSNPHSSKFRFILQKLISWFPSDLVIDEHRPVLDLACGTGQITQLLITHHHIDHIIGLDPYLFEQYSLNTKKVVFPNSFEDIIRGTITLPPTSIIICSYGLHLCDQINELLDILKDSTRYLCVISPHGLPFISDSSGWRNLFSFKYSNIKTSLYTTLPLPITSLQSSESSQSSNFSIDSIDSDLLKIFSSDL